MYETKDIVEGKVVMERMNRKAEKFLKILFKCNFGEVYIDGDISADFGLTVKYRGYMPEYLSMLERGFVKHPIIPMPNKYGDEETDCSDSVITPKGKAYLEELNRNTIEKNVRIIAWLVNIIIAIVALFISIIALNK
jgi:hypothetical protein